MRTASWIVAGAGALLLLWLINGPLWVGVVASVAILLLLWLLYRWDRRRSGPRPARMPWE